MLIIRDEGREGERGAEWHINEPVPPIEGPVVKFQADGDELNFLLKCMSDFVYVKSTGEIYEQNDNEFFESSEYTEAEEL